MPGHGFLYLLHQLPAVRHDPYPAAGTTQEFPYYGGQQMRLARTGGHLYHHTSVKFPLLEKAELHLLLVVAKSVVHAIHYADAGRYRQQKKGRPHASLHAAYSKYLILYGLIFIENPIINKSYKSTDFRIHFLSCC